MIESWGNDRIRLHFDPATTRIAGIGSTPADRRATIPLAEIALAGDGRDGTAGKRHVDGAAGKRMAYEGHDATPDHLRVDLRDPVTGLLAHVHHTIPGGGAVVRSWTELEAGPGTDVVVEAVSSLALGAIATGLNWEDDLTLWTAANPWSGEFRWRGATLAEHGLHDVGMVRHDQTGSKNRIARTSVGAWSTSEFLPMGVLQGPAGLLAWQVEHNGAWHWEIGDRYDALYLSVFGPTAQEHQWSVRLRPGEAFTTVPASFTVVSSFDELGAALTGYRRAVRRAHPDHVRLPVVYNDFLNALMSDPTTERVLPLVEAAAELGAEVYCIDAGWYDDEDGGWWDAVGDWQPSARRFPGGLEAVTARIRELGMRPGLWLEPEVVGRRSTLADILPDEAFFRRDGRRLLEWGRHQLDLRHPAARAHLDEVVDRLVAGLGLEYLKLDYNIDIGPGTDVGGSVGDGLLGHDRALLDWVRSIMDRHPGLVVEGCAAGGSRTDGASGAVFPVQSLTDQQDFRAIPPIAAAAPLAIAPEQAGVWAPVHGGMSDEELAFSLVTAMLGRVHLAGWTTSLTPAQRAVVRAGLDVHKSIRAAGTPFWPLGLPGWRDDWIAIGSRTGRGTFLAVHRRGGPATVELPVEAGDVDVLFPVWGGETLERDGGLLRVTLPDAPSARLLRIGPGAGR